MKIRNGFVSNSSSSSFLIGLKSQPKTWEALHVTLFGNLNEQILKPDWEPKNCDVVSTNDYFATSTNIARYLFNQISDQTPMSDDNIIDLYTFFSDNCEVNMESEEIEEEMKKRYGVGYIARYSISPTNKFLKKIQASDKKFNSNLTKKIRNQCKKDWIKLSKKYKGLKKFAITTQTDGGVKESSITNYLFDKIFANVEHDEVGGGI